MPRACSFIGTRISPIFDRAFDAFWRVHGEGKPLPNQRTGGRSSGGRGPASPRPRLWNCPLWLPTSRRRRTPSGTLQTWSDAGTLAHKDFAEFTPDEMALARAALDRLVWTPGERRTHRWVRGRGPRVDLRRALAHSVRTGGDVFKLPRRRRRTRPRPLVLLCDISGSMERYSRLLLHFAHAIGRRHRRVEAFVFSTELTRVTRRTARPAARRGGGAGVARRCPTGPGGRGSASRCGGSSSAGRAARSMAARSCCSSPTAGTAAIRRCLRDQIRRLQRSCHRLIWLNPLIGTVDYAPLTRGLQAALPFVDDFLPARTLTNLADLALHLNALTGRH